MTTKEWVLIGAAAVGVYLLMGKNAPWWTKLTGMKPGSQQSNMLAEQEADFYKAATIAGDRGTPGSWYTEQTDGVWV